jgi:hypothetical protein
MTQGLERSMSGRVRAMNRRQLLAAGALTFAELLVPRGAFAYPILDGGDGGDASPAGVPTPSSEPAFSQVADATPQEVLRFLSGRDPRYPGASPDDLIGFSPADILETMDTTVLDAVQAAQGDAALNQIYDLIAQHLLASLLALYPDRAILLALDAGHGGKPGVYYDPGSNGTEAMHTRRTVTAVEQRAAAPGYEQVTIRRVFNDAIGDDFGLPPPEDSKERAALTLRNARASMLAREVGAWNDAHPEAPVALHVISVHFDAGSGGILVLHQGDDVPPPFQRRSLACAMEYLARARPAFNDSGLLPRPLALVFGSGLSDDHLLYATPVRSTHRFNPFTGADRTKFPARYAMLQGGLLEQDYAEGALRYYKLA